MSVKQNILFGFVTGTLWAILTGPPVIDLALVLAFFVLVPCLLWLAATEKPQSLFGKRTHMLARSSYWFALFPMAALSIDSGLWAALLACVWAFFTLLVAVNGGLHFIRRGTGAPEEAIIDVGQMFLFAGGVWMVLARAGAADWMPYSTMTVDLTAIHYHYSAFVLPLFAGLFGRWYYSHQARIGVPPSMKRYAVLVAGLGAGPPFVALGIAQGPPLEFFIVTFYVAFIVWLCVWVLMSAFKIGGSAGACAALASASLLFTMGYTTFHGIGLQFGVQIVPQGEMLRWHGAVNAFVFSVLGTSAWMVARPKPRYDEAAFPVSRLRAGGYVGPDVVSQKGWGDEGKKTIGLVSGWSHFDRDDFSSSKVSDLVKDFYLRTTEYDLKGDVNWRWNCFSKLSRMCTTRMGQISLPHSGKADMDGSIVGIDDRKDGRESVRAWIRYNRDSGEPIFAAFYSSHSTRGVTYMNIGLPFPKGVMTGVLRPDNDDSDGLYLTSRKKTDQLGDEGIYFTLGQITVKLPLNEVFHVAEKDGLLQADHTMTLFGFRFLTIHYEIRYRKDK
ncbi:YndJ family protein [Bacillus sp. H-16]|uniref:YndJ family protein n=1 Tax=Alteribacter salitolerans TaxID=2912333 RepID=UPI00196317FA|nr:YndJ family protein [Alteribacter salitolerans]MBM7097865.1 YndJ family protein [Alteribacter salitolerans]